MQVRKSQLIAPLAFVIQSNILDTVILTYHPQICFEFRDFSFLVIAVSSCSDIKRNVETLLFSHLKNLPYKYAPYFFSL